MCALLSLIWHTNSYGNDISIRHRASVVFVEIVWTCFTIKAKSVATSERLIKSEVGSFYLWYLVFCIVILRPFSDLLSPRYLNKPPTQKVFFLRFVSNHFIEFILIFTRDRNEMWDAVELNCGNTYEMEVWSSQL